MKIQGIIETEGKEYVGSLEGCWRVAQQGCNWDAARGSHDLRGKWS